MYLHKLLSAFVSMSLLLRFHSGWNTVFGYFCFIYLPFFVTCRLLAKFWSSWPRTNVR